MENSLFLIIVFYNPTSVQISNADRLGRLYNTIVVDNSSTAITGSHSFYYVPLLINKGIAAAQNVGVNYASEKGATHFIFFDQDSEIKPEYPQRLQQSFIKQRELNPKLAMMGPVFMDTRTQTPSIPPSNNKYILSRELISSGMITSSDVIEKIGQLEEGLFIDYVDFEWCWRAISFGYDCLIDQDLVIEHSVGYNFLKICGLKFYLSSPVRYYYQYRNFLVLLRRNYVPRVWKFKQVVRKLIDIFIVPILAKETWATYKFMFRGLKDGFIGKEGIYE